MNNKPQSSPPPSIGAQSEADDDPHPAPTHQATLELIDPLSLLSQSDHANINTWAAAVFAHLPATGSVRAKVVNDLQMADAHQRFSGIPGTTDVLTFDLAADTSINDAGIKTLDTDLIVCADEATRQAQDHNHTTAHEILLYIIHGTLHCLGFDDHEPEDFKAMHDKEDQLLTLAGIGPLFGRGTHA